jgi:hypothetical protein
MQCRSNIFTWAPLHFNEAYNLFEFQYMAIVDVEEHVRNDLFYIVLCSGLDRDNAGRNLHV